MWKAPLCVLIVATTITTTRSQTTVPPTTQPPTTWPTTTLPPPTTWPTTTQPPPTTTTPWATTTPFPMPWDYCQYNTTCPPGLYCSAYYCECRDAVYTRKDDDLRSCQTIVSGSCYEDGECVRNSFCDTFTQQCTCLPGYLPTPTGDCLADFGAVCNIRNRLECNTYAGLHCIEGRCACADSALGYELGKGCRAQAGRHCGKVLLSWDADRDLDTYYVECVRGLRCEIGEGQFTERGICVLDTP